MDVSGQTVCPGHFISRENTGVGGLMGAGAGLAVLEDGQFYWFCQDLNPLSSSIFPGHFTDCAASY